MPSPGQSGLCFRLVRAGISGPAEVAALDARSRPETPSTTRGRAAEISPGPRLPGVPVTRIMRVLSKAQDAIDPAGTHVRRRVSHSRPLHGSTSRRQPYHLADALHHREHSPRLGSHGHGHRGAARNRAGAGGRDRHRSQEYVPPGPGCRGRQGQALRERRGKGSDYGPSRHGRPRRAESDAAAQDQRTAGDRRGRVVSSES